MKRRYVDRAEWSRLVEREYQEYAVDEPNFHGHIGILKIKRVSEPLWVKKFAAADELVCIAGNGYTWIIFLEVNKYYAITLMLDAQNQIVEWYVDICQPYLADAAGRLYYDDWYLDIVLYSDGHIDLLDEDELEEARSTGGISEEAYRHAYQAREQVLAAIHNGTFPGEWVSRFIKSRGI